MKKSNTTKIFSKILIAVYLMVYSAPFGMCVPGAISSSLTSSGNKPSLRSSSPVTDNLKLEGDVSITKSNAKITLSLRDSDVQQVLRMFADRAGLNIIFHDSVKADTKVTLDMVDVPLNQAFKLIMQVTNLTYYIDNNTMIVMTSDAAKTSNLTKQEIMTIPVKYVDSVVLADFLNNNIFSLNRPGLSNSKIAITNQGTNEILIFGTKNDYVMAKKVVAQFDKKPLEETFVVNHTTPKEMSDMICNTLFKSNSSSSGGSSGGGSSSSGSSSGGSSGPSGGGSGGGPSGGAAPIGNTDGVLTGAADDIALGTGVIACQYSGSVSADSLSSITANNLTVTYYAQRGVIEVRGGSVQQMEMVRDFIANNDKKQPQAYIEISIIELSESGMRNFDNSWQIWSRWFSGSFNGDTSTNTLYPTFLQGEGYSVVDSTDPSKIKYTISKFSGTPTLTYAINYAIENQKGRVLANPRVLVTNGQESTVDLTSDYIKTSQSQVLSGSLSGAMGKTYTIGNDEGIKVTMTPFISPQGYVTLNIKPNYKTIKEKVYQPSADGTTQDLAATLLQRRDLDLKNVRIKDGETLVLGGMIGETETKSIKKIPVLGDLPGVGVMFRNSDTTKEKAELVIMITPKIIKDSEDVVSNPGATL